MKTVRKLMGPRLDRRKGRDFKHPTVIIDMRDDEAFFAWANAMLRPKPVVSHGVPVPVFRDHNGELGGG